MADTVIDNFQGKYRYLSNFYYSPIRVTSLGTEESFIAPTAEHVFQAMKTRNPVEQDYVLLADSPREAKRRGRGVDLRDDWEEIKLNAMKIVVRAKFEQNYALQVALLATGDATLIEGNTWGDRAWGAVWNSTEQKWEGMNMLGHILMDVREELRDA